MAWDGDSELAIVSGEAGCATAPPSPRPQRSRRRRGSTAPHRTRV